MNTLTTFIRDHREQIVNEWTRAAGQLRTRAGLSSFDMRDHVPAILDTLADAIERRDGTPAALAPLIHEHAKNRFQNGDGVGYLVAEYRLLRSVIMELYAQHGDLSADSRPKMQPLAVMHEALDSGISEAVDQHALEQDRTRELFVAMLGHDLRQPLHSILFSANALLQRAGQLDPATLKAASRIASSATRMERMIGELLEFARVRFGELRIAPARCDAEALLQQAVQDIADAHPDRAIRWRAVPDGGDFQAEWDVDCVQQVIGNLLTNAVAHGRDPLAVELRDAGDDLLIQVSNGGEIPPRLLPHIFEAFSVDRPARPKGGLGLGLYIVQQIVIAHGGGVSAESKDGRTVMTVRLPREIDQKPPKPG